ncbi:MAG: carbonic anhydrase [Synechococcaceae bacterium WB9_2_112]|nr:carbonic anhydrase [Synechococcaceae bacterium WB9_2_112]
MPQASAHDPRSARCRRGITHLQHLEAGHQRFLSGQSQHPHATSERLKHLVDGQHPVAAILSCADSRVPVELLFDAGFGDLFVVRNAGNTCTSATIASLEYGIQALEVPLVLVMGHEGCGAVTAACQPHGTLTPELHALVLSIRQGLDEATINVGLPNAFRQNPIQAARHLVRGSALIRERIASGRLLVEAAFYTLRRGQIEWLGAIDASETVHPGHLLRSNPNS